MRTDVALRQPRDPGLQAERTALAWNRTGIAVLVNALLALRSGWSHLETPVTASAIALLLASGAFALYGAWRRWVLLSGQAVIAPPSSGMLAAAAVALVTCGVGLASMLLR